jgi:CRISPR system Cascade subunit CasC
MKIELHILQNFAPSNLNRDDTGAPKDCEFGGYRRARISSQCWKRAMRNEFEAASLVLPEERAARTKRIADEVTRLLAPDGLGDESVLMRVTVAALQGQGLGVPLPDIDDQAKTGRGKRAKARAKAVDQDASDDDEAEDSDSAGPKSQYLLFVPRWLPNKVAEIIRDNWAEAHQPIGEWKFDVGNAKKKKKKVAEYKKVAPKVAAAIETLLKRANGSVDVALFGRMIADKPEWNVDAACQVAQAISTNRVQMDFDFFTAVDDFKPKDNAGSDMMGTVQFNSSCFYRYAVLDVDALRANLDADEALLRRAVAAFVRGFVSAIPTGKQNGMAAHNFPSYALAVVRDRGQSVALTNAFLKPARPVGQDQDLVDDSIGKLEDYAERLLDVLGTAERLTWADRDLPAAEGAPTRVKRLQAFYDDVTARAVGARP